MGKTGSAFVLALLLAFAPAGPGTAQTLADLADARALIEREHFTDAMTLLEPLARLQEREALYRVGWLYEENKGATPRSLDEHDRLAAAGRYYAGAALLGHADAAFRLGRLHLRGVGLARDPIAAAHWLRQAALHDHGKAQYEFGSLLAGGIGVRQDEYAALTWYLIAAERNDVPPAEMAAQSMCERLRRKLDLALEYRLGRERPGQRFKVYYAQRAGNDRYEILPGAIRTAMDRAVDFTPEGAAADKAKPSMPDWNCFSGRPES